ncbi:MAG: nucleotidyltransferase domain-containing protein [Candidatus Caenarcaniphilales bacterium]|nr:nucleotidyltransferase domain-containing protein [Candidatus Caenarcaniphilales bacterium]
MDIYELLKQKKPEILALANIYGAYNVRVFGSVSRREATYASDIDLLVDLEESSNLMDLGGLWEELNNLLEHPTEVFTVNTLKPRLRKSILSDAKEL